MLSSSSYPSSHSSSPFPPGWSLVCYSRSPSTHRLQNKGNRRLTVVLCHLKGRQTFVFILWAAGLHLIFSKKSDLFLKFILLPLSEMVKGTYGHAKDSVELLWWEMTLWEEKRLVCFFIILHSVDVFSESSNSRTFWEFVTGAVYLQSGSVHITGKTLMPPDWHH